MARVRVGGGTSLPSAAERTLPLPGVTEEKKTTAPAPSVDPLGVQYGKCSCGLEQSIGILAKNGGRCASCGKGVNVALAPVDPKTLTPDPAHTKADEDVERAAIQEEAKGLGASFFGGVSIPKAVEEAATKAIAPPPPSVPAAVVVAAPAPVFDHGVEEVTATIGEELYGKPGSFSSYRVGPIGGRTRVLPGETRMMAYRRLREELAQMMNEERELRRAEFLGAVQKAFG